MFAMFVVDHLAWAVEWVGKKWKADGAGAWNVGCDLPVKDGYVVLLDFVAIELILQMLVCCCIESKDDESGCVHIETMGIHGFWIFLAHDVEK